MHDSNFSIPAGDTPHLPDVLQDMVLDSEDINEFLTDLAKEAARLLSSPDHEVLAGVTLLRRRTKATVGSSSHRARMMDEMQYRYDDGPCLRAAREKITYTVADFHTDSRFGPYSAAAHDHGLRSALAVPIPLEGGATAALNLYSDHVAVFTDIRTREAATELARTASRSLRTAVRIARLDDSNKHLRTAMTSRTVIQVAAGIIMAQNKTSHDAAMTILKAASGARNIKLRDVARSVVQGIGQSAPETHFKN